MFGAKLLFKTARVEPRPFPKTTDAIMFRLSGLDGAMNLEYAVLRDVSRKRADSRGHLFIFSEKVTWAPLLDSRNLVRVLKDSKGF